VQALVDGDRKGDGRIAGVLDVPEPGGGHPPGVDEQMSDRDERTDRDGPGGVRFCADPREGGKEGEHVGGQMRRQRPASGRVAQPARLRPRLPVGLQQDVADDVRDEEREQGIREAHAPIAVSSAPPSGSSRHADSSTDCTTVIPEYPRKAERAYHRTPPAACRHVRVQSRSPPTSEDTGALPGDYELRPSKRTGQAG
jgi:hypothetical protein